MDNSKLLTPEEREEIKKKYGPSWKYSIVSRYEKLVQDLELQLESIYCPICQSCGIVDCCGEKRCKYRDVIHTQISENNDWFKKIFKVLENEYPEIMKEVLKKL